MVEKLPKICKIGSQILSSSVKELTSKSADPVQKWTFLSQITSKKKTLLHRTEMYLDPLSTTIKNIASNKVWSNFERYHFL